MKKIALGGKKGKGLFAIVDDEDYEEGIKYSWHLSMSGNIKYACTTIKDSNRQKKNLFLHRLIMKPKSDEIIDHIDGDGLNNLRKNLRICTYKENSRNIHVAIGMSKYRGVSYATKDAWKVSIINDNDESEYLGTYTDEKDAALVYDKYALKYYKDFANINFPDLIEQYEQLNIGYSNTKFKKSSAYVGVYWDRSRNKWAVQIQIKYKAYHIGYFDNEDNAHEAYLYAKSHKEEVVNRR